MLRAAVLDGVTMLDIIERMIETTLRRPYTLPDNGRPVVGTGQRREDLVDGAAPVRPSPVLVDFFAGCGGTSAGFRAAGIEPVAAIDFDPEAAATYGLNFPDAVLFVSDVAELPNHALDAVVHDARSKGRPVVFSACAPCQPFSKQRRGQVSADDARVDILAEVLRFVRRHRPEALFIENVPGLELQAGDRGPFHRVLRSLRRAGYEISYDTVEARSFGVSERRSRLVVIASRGGAVPFPTPTHGAGRAPYRSVRDAIGHLPPLSAGQTHASMNAHRAAGLSSLNLRRIMATPEGGGRLDWPSELQVACHKGRDQSYTDTYGRLRWDDPAPALTTRCISYSNGRFGHPAQHRAITPREAAAIQSFPESFVFTGTLAGMARQVGNAVPPRLAEVFAAAIKTQVTRDFRVAG